MTYQLSEDRDSGGHYDEEEDHTEYATEFVGKAGFRMDDPFSSGSSRHRGGGAKSKFVLRESEGLEELCW